MPDAEWQQAKRIFDDALRQKPEARARFVSEVCGDDETLFREVESLLSSDNAGTIRSIELFNQAINLDPNYAAAWAGKGHAHWNSSTRLLSTGPPDLCRRREPTAWRFY